MACVLLTACISEYNAYGTSQVEGGVLGMGVLTDNRPRHAQVGAAAQQHASVLRLRPS